MPASKVRPAARAKSRRTACHRPAQKPRRFQHDELIAVDLFSGFGGLTWGIWKAGFTTIMAANHNEYKIAVHEKNHPQAEHWIADLVDPESSDYHSAADLPAADILVAGISCTNHSTANTQKAYALGLTLFELPGDEEYEARVTNSERDRATALCVLQYVRKNRPRMILIECTTEFTAWGPCIPGTKIGDGTTYKWWRTELKNLGYNGKVNYLNSQFFGVSQSRDRYYLVCWLDDMPAPDLEHRPLTHCPSCNDVVEAVWTWKTGVPRSGIVRYGQQYHYTCPRCRRGIVPPMSPAINAIDFTDLGKRIGDRERPLAGSTMSRAERCVRRFPEFPAVQVPADMLPANHPWLPLPGHDTVMSTGAAMVSAGNTFEWPGSNCRTRDLSQPLWTQPATNTVGMVTPPIALAGNIIDAHRSNGDGKPLHRPTDTITTTHEKALLIAGVTNYQGAPRSLGETLPTQGGSETMGLLSAGIMPNRTNATNSSLNEPTATLVAGAGSGGLGLVSTGVMPLRRGSAASGMDASMPTLTASETVGLVTAAGFVKQNGGADQAGYRSHPVSSPFGTIVASGGQALVTSGWTEAMGAIWREAVSRIRVEDCYFRMLKKWEVGVACGFEPSDFPGREGAFEVWGTAEQQIDGYGNAVSPAVGQFFGERMRPVLTAC